MKGRTTRRIRDGRSIISLCLLVLAPGALCHAQPGPVVGWGDCFGGRYQPASGSEYMAVCAGGYHSVALTADGSLVTWGENGNGQCNAPLGGGFTAIAAGLYHNLALRADGSILAWGDNSRGQCRSAKSGGLGLPIAKERDGGPFLTIAAGSWHSLAIRADGSLTAWGWNDQGQCDVPPGNDYTSIAGGYYHSLALRANRSVVAWGGNGDGQCDAPAGNHFVGIAAGALHSVALRRDGSMVAWGPNGYAECEVPAGRFAAIAAGSFHGVAIRDDRPALVEIGPVEVATIKPAKDRAVAAQVPEAPTPSIPEPNAAAGRLDTSDANKPIQVETREIAAAPIPEPNVAIRRPDVNVPARPPAPVARDPGHGSRTTERERQATLEPAQAKALPVVEPNLPVSLTDFFRESIAADTRIGADPNAAPVYHFVSSAPVRHFCTISEREKYKLLDTHSGVWAYAGIAFFAYPQGKQPAGARAVHRFWSDSLGRHYFTLNESEKEMLVRDFAYLWKYEGVAWYIAPAQPPGRK